MPVTTIRPPIPHQSTASPEGARLRARPRMERAPRICSAPSTAGLIVVTGPPMSGKDALGHFLNEYLPDSVHVSQTDPVVADLRDEDPAPLEALLRRIRSELRCGHKVVFSGRLASPKQRQRVLRVAREIGVPRLLVEVEGTDPDALERATQVADTLAQIQALMQELKELLPRYSSLSEREQDRVPTLTVPAEDPVEEQIKAVLDGWAKLGSVC